MTLTVDHTPQQTISLSLNQRREILDRVLSSLQKRFYSPEKLKGEWQSAVKGHRQLIESADSPAAFEQAMTDLLAELHTSHLGFFNKSARRTSSRAAISAAYLADETPYGTRWIFQDVHAGGPAAVAGIEPGDILLSVNGRDLIPPDHPVFSMGQVTKVEIVGKSDQRREVTINVQRPKGKKLHFIEPKLVEARHLENGIGYLRVAMFPGVIGIDVANEVSRTLEGLGAIESLIIDLRGNTGGGVGALRVMSLLTPDRVPVGFAIEKNRLPSNLETEKQKFRRFSGIPSSKRYLWLLALKYLPIMLVKAPVVLETEGLGRKGFQGRTALLVDRHTASAAEMIVAFARENKLATIVGESTAGRLLSATSVKVGHGYRLALPTGGYYTWQGSVLEGTPIEPDKLVEFDWQRRRLGFDAQLDAAMEVVSRSQTLRANSSRQG